MVVTLQDSVAFGAHFYALDWMYETLQAMLVEHFYDNATNTEHPKAYIVFIQWVLSTKSRIKEENGPLGVSPFEFRSSFTKHAFSQIGFFWIEVQRG
jgi:hypothetical protein